MPPRPPVSAGAGVGQAGNIEHALLQIALPGFSQQQRRRQPDQQEHAGKQAEDQDQPIRAHTLVPFLTSRCIVAMPTSKDATPYANSFRPRGSSSSGFM